MIGVYDSGIGGLSVLSEIRARMPRVDLLYVADRARAPYGSASLSEVEEMAHEITAWLVGQGCSTIVVACNTASAAALHPLRARFADLPIVGMEPAVKPAVALTNSGVIAVFATAATFQGELFDSLLARHRDEAQVLTVAAPGWVDLVEKGMVSSGLARAEVAAGVEPVLGEGADVLVLGCTHFPFLRPVIEEVAGLRAVVYDPAPAVAAQTERVASTSEGSGTLRIAGSGDLGELARLASQVAGIVSDGPLLPFTS